MTSDILQGFLSTYLIGLLIAYPVAVSNILQHYAFWYINDDWPSAIGVKGFSARGF